MKTTAHRITASRRSAHHAHAARRGWGPAALTLLLLSALLPGTGAARATASVADTWTLTGTMSIARSGHMATLLRNGKVLVAGGGTASAELYDPPTGAWTPTGAMSTDRFFSTATLLRNGKVLVAGGCNGGPCASAELYDPATGTFTATGNMTAPRAAHTAALLSNGQVLVAGGVCYTGCGGSFFYNLASAELYNPTTGTWTATGAMAVGRAGHTETLLSGGKVLVAGGLNGCDDGTCFFNTSAELYDPATGTWTHTGSMAVPRYHHTATLLRNGNVLAAGGGPGGASTELYDPSTGTWTRTGAMSVARAYHTATLLRDGQVLVAGGCNANACAGAELYDPHSGFWSVTGAMLTPRLYQAATLLTTGQVLVEGGCSDPSCSPRLSSAELYTPGPSPLVRVVPLSLTFASQLAGTTSEAQSLAVINSGSAPLVVASVTLGGANPADFLLATTCTAAPVPPAGQCSVTVRFAPTTSGVRSATITVTDNAPSSPQGATVSGYGAGPDAWAPTGSMSTGHQNATATLLTDGRVLVAGGDDAGINAIAAAELYDPATATWAPTGSMTTPRDSHTATLLPNGKVLVAGGKGPNFVNLATAELYDPATGTWTATGTMHFGRYYHTATLLHTAKVLVAGGGVATAELYDPATGSWTTTGTMSAARFGHTATLLPDGRVLAAGADGVTDTSAELYDPATGSWTPTGSMHTGRRLHTATLLPTGTVLVAGGQGAACCNPPFASAELYDPATSSWAPTGSMATGREFHTATLLPTGEVLVTGGCTSYCNPNTLTSTELYDPHSGTWAPTGSLITARQYHTATLLPSGTLLVAGGATDCCTPLTSAELYTPALLTDSPAGGGVGQHVGVRGRYFFAAEPVQVFWDMTGTVPLATTTTGASGGFSATITVPAASAGPHTLIAVGGHSGAVATAAFRVTP